MPYISQHCRKMLNEGANPARESGELNYLVTKLCLDYLVGRGFQNINYTSLNEIIGVLECVKQEFYRRILSPYEDKKKELNGDVYNVL